MEGADEPVNVCEAYPMNGGDGPNSYANNSIHQRGAADAAKQFVNKAIAEKLDIEILLSSNKCLIADLGCSVGPNTFFSVQHIIETVEFKYKSQGLNSQIPEFHVFFNDHTSNDFNLLFKSLPNNRQYYAAGVPGSFYGRLLPNASVHFFHSSNALPWLSRVPKAVKDKTSPAWNKGQIHYSNSKEEVIRAYEAQHVEDMQCFLHARAQEIVFRGLMVLLLSGRPDGAPHSHSHIHVIFQILGSCLMEMAHKGVFEEESVDAFNIPTYLMSSRELEAAVERNGCFSVERQDYLPQFGIHDIVFKSSQIIASQVRASMEVLIKQQFGDEILDELFDLYGKKLEEQHFTFESEKAIVILLVLRRNAN